MRPVIPVQGVLTTAGKPAASTSLFSVSLSFPVEYSWDAPAAVGSLGRLSHYCVVAPLSDGASPDQNAGVGPLILSSPGR